MNIEIVPASILRPYARNARVHSARQVRQIARSIERFGFTSPILISDDNEVIAGHGRLSAAKLLKMPEVPVVRLSHLSAEERRAYVIADNKIALNSGWDPEMLAIELQSLIDIDFDVEVTGFTMAEIDLTLDAAQARSPDASDKDDALPAVEPVAATRAGDIWVLGRHRLACGDARDAEMYRQLLKGARVDLIFTDPPYNVPINGHVCGSGKVQHREFAFASGEMSRTDFTVFLATTLGAAAAQARDGAIAFVCMDWRGAMPLMQAGELVFDELKQLCVWNKTNGGMGTFYRSKHEFVFVFKIGAAPHVNNFGLGDTGRYRTNVWDYPGISSMSASRASELEMHPTVKPVKMVIDAIEDCSRRGDIVLDCFAGSGTTLIAAERCGRAARVIEYDPAYCDVIIRRFQTATGKFAVLETTGASFDDVSLERAAIGELVA